MSINIRIAMGTEIPLIKEISTRTAWETFSEHQRRTLDKEKWRQHIVELLDKMVKREHNEIFVAEDGYHSFLGYV